MIVAAAARNALLHHNSNRRLSCFFLSPVMNHNKGGGDLCWSCGIALSPATLWTTQSLSRAAAVL